MIIKKFLVLFSLLLAIISVLTLKVNAEENNNSFNFFNVNYDYSKNCYHTTIDNYDNLENAADFKNNENLPK